MRPLAFRQVHLDFHTSEAIKGIGKDFSKKQFQDMLKLGHVNSITVFSKCHHGWAYHPSKANEMHPNLEFDLLKEQIEAAHEIGVRTPVYISAGLDEKLAKKRPEWLIRSKEGTTNWVPSFDEPGYHQFCFNTPYLDYLIEQLKEVLLNYDCDSIFLDIVGVRTCYCKHCRETIKKQGTDMGDKDALLRMWENTYSSYTKRVGETIDEYKPGTPVFHNGGHIRRGRRDLAHMNSHLEIESLPTGGWGYQHFPLSARYAQGLDMEYLGMTGKFHTTWGEFGGYKHPNALRYEAALCIANGAKCSVGDQLHPEGLMDKATYALIGKAYAEVEAKEEWCSDAKNIADIAMLSTEAVISDAQSKGSSSDAGCVKILLEGKYLFDVIDLENDFNKYKLIILPDVIRVDEKLKEKLDIFVNDSGKILATGTSGLKKDADEFIYDFGVKYVAKSEYNPSYFKPNFRLNSLENASFVMYSEGLNVELVDGNELGEFQNSYFNREAKHFCSHQHTPPTLKRFSSGAAQGNDGIYLAWNIFDEYDSYGSLILKEMILYSIDKLLGDNITLKTNLQAQGIVTLTKQKAKDRYVQHLLYAVPVRRGMKDGIPIEIIEDIVKISDIDVNLKIDEDINNIYLAPEMIPVEFNQKDGVVNYRVDELECHAMVVLEY